MISNKSKFEIEFELEKVKKRIANSEKLIAKSKKT
ncbi:hypothetical protein FBALC1_11017 [Flavobacteriales bacterium ALC-1]|nr:hypothetical protein FBALC1_11017 [Flavobacteriales bacterium ALC-1]